MAWTEERIDRAANLWREGFSGSEIARFLGCVTRSAVLGKLTRLGIAGNVERHQRTKDRGVPRSRPRRGKIIHLSKKRQRMLPEAPAPIAPLNTPFLDNHGCKAITDNTPYEQLCCGHAAAPGHVYCAWHVSLYYQPAKAKVAA